MSPATVVATANVLRSLPTDQARAALLAVLDGAPDLVGLQEWDVSRVRLLRETGAVRLLPGPRPRRSPGPYHWAVPLLGDCAVGARTDRYDVLGSRTRVLSRPGRADKPDRWLGLEPPRLVTVGCYRDRRSGRVVSLLSYHLVPGVQARGRYREDRPRLVARHRAEVRRLQQLVDEELDRGRDVYAVGDSNFDGLRLAGLTSAWEGREGLPGTFGARRKIDDVHGPGAAASVTVVPTPSDHRAVLTAW